MFAKRILDVAPSATFKYAAMAKKPGMINLTVGRTDFGSPQVMRDAAIMAIKQGAVHYTPTKGIPELREKMAKKLTKENKLKDIDPEKILVSAGGKNILFEIIMALVNPGDKVAIANPSWVSYEAMVKFAQGEIKWLPLKPEKGFIPDDDYMGALENSGAKLLVLNSPNNPTGAVYPKEVLKQIISIAEENDIWIISDEVYEKIIFEGSHFSVGSAYDKTITVNAISKSASATGWRIGYAACPDFEVINKMNIIQGMSVSCCTSFAQYGAVQAFSAEAEKEAKKMQAEMKKRRDYAMKRVEELDAVCVKPNGAFYIFPAFNNIDGVTAANNLLEQGVATVPGSPFGTAGRNCIRISYGNVGVEKLAQAFDRMKSVKGIGK